MIKCFRLKLKPWQKSTLRSSVVLRRKGYIDLANVWRADIREEITGFRYKKKK